MFHVASVGEELGGADRQITEAVATKCIFSFGTFVSVQIMRNAPRYLLCHLWQRLLGCDEKPKLSTQLKTNNPPDHQGPAGAVFPVT
jgi:hypothetical protein